MLCGPEFSPEQDRDTGEASALAAECLQSCSPPEHLQPPPYLPVRPRGQLHGKRQGRSREEAGCSLDGFQAFDSFAVRQSPGLGACRGLESASSTGSLVSRSPSLVWGVKDAGRSCLQAPDISWMSGVVKDAAPPKSSPSLTHPQNIPLINRVC